MVFEPIYISRALNTGTSIQQGDLFYSAGLHRSHVIATAPVQGLLEGYEDMVEVLLVLKTFLTENS